MNVDEPYRPADARPERRDAGSRQSKVSMSHALKQGLDNPLDCENAELPSPPLREVGKPPNRTHDADPLPTPATLEVDGGACVGEGRLAASYPVGQFRRQVWQTEGPLKVAPLLGPGFRVKL